MAQGQSLESKSFFFLYITNIRPTENTMQKAHIFVVTDLTRNIENRLVKHKADPLFMFPVFFIYRAPMQIAAKAYGFSKFQ